MQNLIILRRISIFKLGKLKTDEIYSTVIGLPAYAIKVGMLYFTKINIGFELCPLLAREYYLLKRFSISFLGNMEKNKF